MIADRYVLDGLSEQQLNFLRRTVNTDVSVAVAALAARGVATLDEAQDTAELTALGRFAAGRSRGMPLPGEPVLQVRITLLDVADPPVWRRVLVPAAFSLDRVHRVIQAAMGWQNYHMHVFRVGELGYAPDPEGMLGHLEEAKVRLADVAGVGERIGYEYDFGDSWEHELLIEACTKAEAHQTYPACTAGEGACPPEDSQLPGTQGDPRRPVQQRVRGDADLGGVADLRHVRSRKLRPGRGQRKSVDRLTHLGMRRPVRVPRLPIGPASHRLSRSAPRRCQPEQTGRVAADASFGRFGERAALPRPTSPSQRRPGTGT